MYELTEWLLYNGPYIFVGSAILFVCVAMLSIEDYEGDDDV
jgi:hypothetical protein